MEFKNAGKSRSKRLKGAGRKPLDESTEEILFVNEWIVELRSRNLRVSRSMIMRQAKTLSSDETFKACIGWLNRFMTRKGLSLRRRTTVSQNPPSACIQKLVDFVIRLRKLRLSQTFAHNDIFAMDETACWFDMPSDTTVHLSGS